MLTRHSPGSTVWTGTRRRPALLREVLHLVGGALVVLGRGLLIPGERGGLVLLHAESPLLVRLTQIVLRGGGTGVGGPGVPLERLGLVLLDALSALVPAGDLEHGVPVAAPRGVLVPASRVLVTPVHATPVLVELGHVALGGGAARPRLPHAGLERLAPLLVGVELGAARSAGGCRRPAGGGCRSGAGSPPRSRSAHAAPAPARSCCRSGGGRQS